MTVVQVEGADRLAATLRRAGRDLADLGPANAEAGQIATAAVSARAPRRTGRLAGSFAATVSPGGVAIASALVYARVIHDGSRARGIRARPFAVEAIEDAAPRIAQPYERAVVAALDQVRGA